MIQFELPQNNSSIIKIIGVGGGGGNAVNYMYGLGIEGVDFIVCNTDQKALRNSPVPTKIQLGPTLTAGLGAGANPEIGRLACEESIGEIERLLRDNTKMVFVTAGMGGGTGTGAAPIVAKIAKDLGILTVGIVTTPFSYEGRRRMKQAEDGIAELRNNVDTILVISNDKLRLQFGNIAASQAFGRADDILATAAKCITDVINSQGHIVVDFADVTTVMRDGGRAILGSAAAAGSNRAYEAVENAIKSPLLNDHNIHGAKWVLLNINSARGVHEHTLDEVEIIQAYIQEQAGDACDVIFGTGFDDNLGEKISVTIIATGFNYNPLDEAYNKEHRRPKQEHDKEVYVLSPNGSEQPAQATAETMPVNQVPTAYMPQAQEPEIDPLAPRMVVLDPPAIPQSSAIGMGLGMAYSRQNAPVQAVAETLQRPWPTYATPVQETPQVDTPRETFTLETPVQAEPIQETPSTETWPLHEPNMSFTPEVGIETPPQEPQLEDLLTFDTFMSETNTTVEEPEAPVYFELSVETEPVADIPATPEVTEVSAEVPPVDTWGMSLQETELKDEFITIQGVTINRRKGNRYLTDDEINTQVEFEIQKRSFEERASRLRSLSFNVRQGDMQEPDDTPAYLRRNKPLEETPASHEDAFSTTRVTKPGSSSIISTLNSFLHGNNPD